MQQHVFTIAKICSHYGVEHAVICPGSRSAPLVFAFSQNKKIKCHSVIDERSAAFMALGMAQQLQKPVVLICTSGTACLNFFPAIAEAYYQKVPLLIISADRPPELLNQQDGQMIMQKGVFGKHVLGSHELLCFEEDKIDYKLTERIVTTAIQETMQPSGYGPVHINTPLREPLYDVKSSSGIPKLSSFKEVNFPPIALPTLQLDELAGAWKKSKKRMILVGQLPVSKSLQMVLNACVNHDDVVIFSDVVSNQHESGNIPLFDSIIQFISPTELKELEPDFILSFGGPMVSKSLKNWLKKQKPAYHFRIQSNENLIDTYNNVTHPIIAEELNFLEAFVSINRFKQSFMKPYASDWKLYNKKIGTALKQFVAKNIWSEPIVMQHILNALPENSQLQLANSSVVRYASWLGIPLKALHVYGNRGTSGIDGATSTAVGSAKMQLHKTVTLISGDLSLFYDRNAFWQTQIPNNLRIIVFNNCGGKIFEWIDGPSDHTEVLDFFITPQHQSVELLARQFDLHYYTCNHIKNLSKTLEKFYAPHKNVAILELPFMNEENIKTIKEFRNLKVE